ncbi:MAG: transglycosylase domain-containing protein, partial [Defluviitaleaceae bacterium]|nr:transglycosylase domain-containing protein [Defluviitaleaceae bacterium]
MDYSREHNAKQIKSAKQHTAKTRNKLMIIVGRVVVAVALIVGFGLGGAALGAFMGVVESAPREEAIAIMPSVYPSIIVDQHGVEIARLTGDENREYVTLDRIPLHLQHAFIAIEDERFFTHNGVDIRGMFRALHHNLTNPTTQGASTITQQIIKNNVRGIPRNTLGTKIQEIYLAVVYERDLVELLGSREAAKNHILEVYLNTINLHHRLHGVMTAARYYFDKDVEDLTISESAVIASITQNPSRFSPVNNPDNNRTRKLLVLENMLRLGFITEEEHAYAVADTDVYARIIANERVTEQINSVHSYFVDSLKQQLARDLSEEYAISLQEAFHWLYNGGLRIYATKNTEMQAIMDEAFLNDDLFPALGFRIDIQYFVTKRNLLTGRTEHLERRGTVPNWAGVDGWVDDMRDSILRDNEYIAAERVVPIPQPQAAMVVMDWRNGHVLAVTGGRGEKMLNLALNRAVDSPRQPGSVFKTIASFAPAIDLGRAHAGTIINDAPFTIDGYTPRNWYGDFWGPSSLRRAMAWSMNVVSVINMFNTGLEDSFQYVLNFGFTTVVTPDNPVVRGNQVFHDMVPSLPLGGLTHGVTQLETTAAFAAIANNGMYNYPKFYSRVLDSEGNIVLENVPVNRQILRPAAAYILTDMMRDVLTNGTGGTARLRNTTIPVSGKTGTTTNDHDLLFVGYTPYFAAGVWMGYDQPDRLRTNNHHMMIWRDVMERIHADLPFRDFEQPPGVIRAAHCSVSGMRAVPGLCHLDPRGNIVVTDLFIVGDQGDVSCHVHVRADICTVSGMRHGPSCPAHTRRTIVGAREGFYSPGSEAALFTVLHSQIDGSFCTHDGNFPTRPTQFFDSWSAWNNADDSDEDEEDED